MLRKLNMNECDEWIKEFDKDNNDDYFNIPYIHMDDNYLKYLDRRNIYYLLCDKDSDSLINYTKEYIEYFNLCSKNFKEKKIKFFYFLTVTGKSRIIVNNDTILKMKNCLKTIFNNDSYKRYHKVIYNIETGKYMDRPNLHCHCVIIFDSTNKNFKRDFSRCWLKYFKTDGIDFKMDSFNYPSCREIYEDKCNYLNNLDKSIEHQNYTDLKILEHVE